jgi:eukaryotic-like serine/threonine-protein kinase
MQLVRGVRITDYCDESHVALKERLELFMQVCHAVQQAHPKARKAATVHLQFFVSRGC